jgi:fanconi-associated nuclease 1
MALREQSLSSHNQALGAHVKQQTPSSRQDKDSTEPLLKRLKTGHYGSDSDSIQDDPDGWTAAIDASRHITDVESCLAPVRTDQEMIDEYESSQAAQQEVLSGSEALNRLNQRRWIRGRSSIYVDAFNLALEIVLDEESHLFNEAERALFEFWKNLSYEAQYL